MFGDNVPQERAESAKEAARTCDALLAMLITKGTTYAPFCLEYIDNFSFKSAAWEPFRDFIPEDERNCFVDSYNKRLTSSNPIVLVAPHISFLEVNTLCYICVALS